MIEMTACWIILAIGIFLLVLGIKYNNIEMGGSGCGIILCAGMLGFVFYGNFDTAKEENSNVPIAEIVRTKNSIMVRPDEKDAAFIESKDYAIYSAIDKNLYLLKKNKINHYGGLRMSVTEICISEEINPPQTLEKKE